jgi:hypothetical protein
MTAGSPTHKRGCFVTPLKPLLSDDFYSESAQAEPNTHRGNFSPIQPRSKLNITIYQQNLVDTTSDDAYHSLPPIGNPLHRV